MKEVQIHTFCGKRFHIHLGELHGLCICCEEEEHERELFLMEDLATREGLITAIHEAMHACDFNRQEITVNQEALDIGNFLWRLGFRQCEED